MPNLQYIFDIQYIYDEGYRLFIIPFLYVELLFAAVWVLARAVVWLCRRRIDPKQELKLLLLFVTLAVIIRFTFFQFFRHGGAVDPMAVSTRSLASPLLNLTPLVNILHFATVEDLLINIVGNVAMFIPLGIVLPVVFPKLNRLWKVALTGLLISLTIELLQLPMVGRTTDVDDLLLNTLGCVLGYGIYALCRALRRRFRRSH